MDDRYIILIAILITVILLLISVPSFGATVEISVEAEINPELTEAEITCRYSSAETFAGFDTGLQYNSTILTITGVELGREVSNFRMVTSDFSAGDGMIYAVDYSLSGAAGEGDLLRFFVDIAPDTTDSDLLQALRYLNFHDIRFCDATGNDLSVTLNYAFNYGMIFGTVMDALTSDFITNATIQVDSIERTTDEEGKYSLILT